MSSCPLYEPLLKCMWKDAHHSDIDKPDKKADKPMEPCHTKKCDGYDKACELFTVLPEGPMR